jgi:hypothetical protein
MHIFLMESLSKTLIKLSFQEEEAGMVEKKKILS